MNIDYKKSDKLIYDNELKDFLPGRIFDAHIHLFDESCMPGAFEFPPQNCYQKFGGKCTLEDCLAYVKKLLPEQEFYCNHFGQPSKEFDLNAAATYTGKISDNKKFFGMTLVSPKDKISNIKKRIETNKLVGYKPYLNFVDKDNKNDITISDMLPKEQMEYADQKGLVITLHIPRAERLADTVNQKQMVKLCNDYPNTTIIFAHIGRAYYLKNAIGYLNGIARCPNAYIDTAMVNHEGVLEYAFQKFPRDRIVFGSDAPIAFLRGKSVEINNQYAYLMGEDYEIGSAIYDAKHVVEFTFFYYEQLRGIKLAAKRCKLSDKEIENIFFNNSFAIFSKATKNLNYI